MILDVDTSCTVHISVPGAYTLQQYGPRGDNSSRQRYYYCSPMVGAKLSALSLCLGQIKTVETFYSDLCWGVGTCTPLLWSCTVPILLLVLLTFEALVGGGEGASAFWANYSTLDCTTVLYGGRV